VGASIFLNIKKYLYEFSEEIIKGFNRKYKILVG